MLIVVLTAFTLSWLPNILVQLIRMIDHSVIYAGDLRYIELVTVSITFLNNAINPFIYIGMSR